MIDTHIDIGLRIHYRHWHGPKRPFVLVHGLSSNCRTWDGLAEILAEAGHAVITLDQRGHGLSDKPTTGYDFQTITADLARFIEALGLTRPIMVGQSWGGNVMLAFGANYPQVAHGLGFVDGGYLDLQSRPNTTWERIRQELRPPNLTGIPRDDLKQRIHAMHPDWSEQGIEGTLANFETLPDDTLRPWLSWANHEQILRAMWEQRPTELYPLVKQPVLICVAGDQSDPFKANLLSQAERGLARAETLWFANTDHDIHVQRPARLAQHFLSALETGVWSSE